MNLTLSIVVPAYNSEHLIGTLLTSVEEQTAEKDSFEVIIVNDGSTDATAKVLENFQQKTQLRFRYINSENRGPGHARNLGAAKAACSWIGLIDADVILHKDWVRSALDCIKQHPDAGAIEGKTVISDRDRISFFTHQTENLTGGKYVTCNFLVRKDLVTFCPKYRKNFREDSDLGFQILSKGYSILFSPNIIVYHPPLPAHKLTPFKLAARYYYDGLLAARFPAMYADKIDTVHCFGAVIAHARRKLMYASVGCYLTGLTSLLAGSSKIGALLLLVGLFCALLPAIVKIPWKNWNPKDVALACVFALSVPWYFLYHYIKGRWMFRKEQPFQP